MLELRSPFASEKMLATCLFAVWGLLFAAAPVWTLPLQEASMRPRFLQDWGSIHKRAWVGLRPTRNAHSLWADLIHPAASM